MRPQLPMSPRDEATVMKLRNIYRPPGERLGLFHRCPTCGRYSPVLIVQYPYHLECMNCHAWIDRALVAWVRLEYPKNRPWHHFQEWFLPFDHESFFSEYRTDLHPFLKDRNLAAQAESFVYDTWQILNWNHVRPGSLVLSANYVYESAYSDWLDQEGMDDDEVPGLTMFYESKGYDYLQYRCLCGGGGGCNATEQNDGWYCFLNSFSYMIENLAILPGWPMVLAPSEFEWCFDFEIGPHQVVTFSDPDGHENIQDLLILPRAC